MKVSAFLVLGLVLELDLKSPEGIWIRECVWLCREWWVERYKLILGVRTSFKCFMVRFVRWFVLWHFMNAIACLPRTLVRLSGSMFSYKTDEDAQQNYPKIL